MNNVYLCVFNSICCTLPNGRTVKDIMSVVEAGYYFKLAVVLNLIWMRLSSSFKVLVEVAIVYRLQFYNQLRWSQGNCDLFTGIIIH